MIDRINLVKEKLNSLVEDSELISDKVLNVSEELDLLILEYYKNKEECSKK